MSKDNLLPKEPAVGYQQSCRLSSLSVFDNVMRIKKLLRGTLGIF